MHCDETAGQFELLVGTECDLGQCDTVSDGNTHRYGNLRYDSVYLTCSKKLTGSQLSLPHVTTP